MRTEPDDRGAHPYREPPRDEGPVGVVIDTITNIYQLADSWWVVPPLWVTACTLFRFAGGSAGSALLLMSAGALFFGLCGVIIEVSVVTPVTSLLVNRVLRSEGLSSLPCWVPRMTDERIAACEPSRNERERRLHLWLAERLRALVAYEPPCVEPMTARVHRMQHVRVANAGAVLVTLGLWRELVFIAPDDASVLREVFEFDPPPRSMPWYRQRTVVLFASWQDAIDAALRLRDGDRATFRLPRRASSSTS